MSKLVVVKLFVVILILVFFTTGCWVNDKRATVNLNGVEHTIFYTVEEEKDKIDWNGVQDIVVKYRVRDEATRNSNFYIYAEFENGMKKSLFPRHFYEVNEQSFLQKIIIENDKDMGTKIFLEIISQIEK